MFKNITNILTITTISLLLGFSASADWGKDTFSRIPARLNVIQNYGDWNDVLISFSGALPNGCYSKNETNAWVVNDNIYIENQVSRTRADLCTLAIVPYISQVPIHNLAFGTYTVFVKDRDGNFLNVTEFYVDPT